MVSPATALPIMQRQNKEQASMSQQDEHEADSTSGASAAPSSSTGAVQDGESSMSSMDTSQEESGSESSESSSSEGSEDSASDDGDDDDVATIKPGKKPDFSAKIASGAPSLEDRLKSFLPQLAEANSKLGQEGGKDYSMEDVKEDEPHIEMSLGLGLLEEKSGKEGEEDADSSEDEGEDEGGRKEKDVMGKLMGGRDNQAAGIEEVS